MLIQLKNGKPVGHAVLEENFRMLYPETSFPFPLTDSDVEPFGYGLYEFSSQPTPDTYENVVEVEPVKNASGIWMQTWSIVPMTTEEVADKNEQLRQKTKQQAEYLLQQTDWTQMPDVDLVNKADFTAYRVEVRAIALNPPVTVSEWPVKPEEVWATESL
jgi:hypothetical protein